MMTAEDKSIYGQIKTKGEQLADLVKMAEDMQNNNDKSAAEAYQHVLDDAWEEARKIAQQWEEDTDTEHRLVIDDSISVTLDSMTASEAIEKLKAYEEKQKADDEIKVGDEVTHKSSPEKCGIVTKELENVYYIMWADGSCGVWDRENIVKTGRHFDIAKILEAM